MWLIETGGSTLAAGLFHASFNASGQIAALDGTWQYIPTVPILVVALAVWRAAQGRSLVSGFAPQLAAGEDSAASAASEASRSARPAKDP